MGYTIELGEGTSQLILDSNFMFDLDFNLTPASSGLSQSISVHIIAEGDVVEATAADVINQIVDFSEEVTAKAVARRVVIKLDGTTKYDFQTSDAFGTPLVTRFRVTTQDEGGESHLHWTMGIFVLLSGGGGESGDAIINLRTSYRVTKENQKIIRKAWKAACQASSAATAESKVRGFAPAETNILEEVETFAQEAKAEGIWIWEATKKRLERPLVVEEAVEISGGGADYVGGARASLAGGVPPDPILHEKLRTEQLAVVSGVVRGYNREELVPPPAHWQETDTMKRAWAREITYAPAPVGGEQFNVTGLYELKYMEVWIATGGVPDPEHGDHLDVILSDNSDVPPTGKIKNR